MLRVSAVSFNDFNIYLNVRNHDLHSSLRTNNQFTNINDMIFTFSGNFTLVNYITYLLPIMDVIKMK